MLLPQLHDTDAGVAACALSAFGELAKVTGDAVRPHTPRLLSQLHLLLQDRASPQKRRAALHALCTLLRSSAPLHDGAMRHSVDLLSTLLEMLRSEQDHATRLSLLRALGILGATDPGIELQNALNQKRIDAVPPTALDELADAADPHVAGAISPSVPDFYPTVSIRALTRILRDPSLRTQHGPVVVAISSILQSLGLKGVPYLPSAVPLLLRTAASDDVLCEIVVQHLGVLVGVVRQHIRPYLPAILPLITSRLRSSGAIQIHCVTLAEQAAAATAVVVDRRRRVPLCAHADALTPTPAATWQLCLALRDEFEAHLPALTPHLLAILHSDRSKAKVAALKVLHALAVFGQNLQELVYLVVPAVLRLCEHAGAPTRVRRRAVRLLGKLASRLGLREFASRVVHTLVRVVSDDGELSGAAHDALCSLARAMGADFSVYVPMLSATLHARGKLADPRFEPLLATMRMPGARAPRATCHPPLSRRESAARPPFCRLARDALAGGRAAQERRERRFEFILEAEGRRAREGGHAAQRD